MKTASAIVALAGVAAAQQAVSQIGMLQHCLLKSFILTPHQLMARFKPPHLLPLAVPAVALEVEQVMEDRARVLALLLRLPTLATQLTSTQPARSALLSTAL